MTITKYPQSCLIVEVKGKRILIDPGSFVADKYSAKDLLPVDLILITHEHSDHLDKGLLSDIIARSKVPVIANESASKLIPEFVTEVIRDGQKYLLDDIEIVARELPHSLLPNGQPGPQNTGYVIEGAFFHPGDGLEIDNLKVNSVAAPIAGPDISPKDVYDFVKSVGAKMVIPIHYNYWIAKPEMFVGLFGDDVEVFVLQDSQSVNLD